MIHIGAVETQAPAQWQTPLQAQVYRTLAALGIPFERVTTDEVITMEDCAAVNQTLGIQMVKTLFLCNRQQTAFYLFITRGDKPFVSKAFSAALNVPRVSFAPVAAMERMLGTPVGAATVFSCLLDTTHQVRVIFDRDVLNNPWYGCSDGTTTGYMKLRTADITGPLLAFSGHVPEVVEI